MAIHTKLSLLISFMVLLFAACQSGTAPEEKELRVQLQCETISRDKGSPQSAVYAIVNQNKMKLASISRCDSISPASFEDYDIPKGALAAAGGWWGGTGDFFYAIKRDSAIVFYQGWAEEGQDEDRFHYKAIGAYADGKYQLEMPAKTEELVGTYALSRESGSHILFVGLKEDSLKAEYFTTEGILPPVNQLNLLMTSMEHEAAADLRLNPITLSFTSSLGRGRFIPEEEGAAVWLMDKQAGGQALKMEKILSKDYSLPVE